MTSAKVSVRPNTDPPPRAPAERAPALSALDEMLERLESVTDAGRRHLMSKILTVLTAHPLASAPCFVALFEDMRREALKPAPDGRVFARAARPLVATLETTGA
jgi:hypothetical protein